VHRIWIALVFASVCWQPFRLGFYLDDWGSIAAAPRHGAPFSYARFAYLNYIDVHRPALGPIRYLASSVLSDHLVAWHLLVLAAGVLVAYSIGRIAVALIPSDSAGERRLAYSIAACWLILPWAIGFRIWAHFFAVQVCLLASLWAMLLVLTGWRAGRPRVILPAALCLAACLGYELFHFQIVPVAMIGVLWVRTGRARRRDVLRTLAGLAASEAIALAWIYVTKVLQLWSRKTVQPTWLLGLASDFHYLIPEMLRSLSGVRLAFSVASVALAILCATVVFRTWQSRAARADLAYTAAQLVCCGAGATLGLLIYTLGGYGLIARGVESRVFSMFSVWLVIGACLAGASVWRNSGRRMRAALITAGAATGICLAAGNLLRARDWAEAWQQERQILRDAPVAQLAATAPGSTVLYIHPISVDGAPILSAPWDINTAMPLYHPSTGSVHFVVYVPLWGNLISNGRDLRYTNGQVAESNTTNLHVWIPRTAAYYKAVRPFLVHQDYTIEER
jgi:hypothetical protein